MPDIKDSVGEGGSNQVHDVALLQAMLRVVKDAKNAPYLGVDYDGSYGAQTRAALERFQNDHKLAAAK
ncbi:peptidoglycan-binding domain-containing protein, partial [Delftia tsuruhatensis]